MSNDKITVNLSRFEVACKCGCGFGLADGDFSIETAEIFELIRQDVSDYFDEDTPIIIGSGCRCKKHNMDIGGAEHSLHLEGKALDIQKPTKKNKKRPNGISYNELCKIVLNRVGSKGGVGKYSKSKTQFVHFDTRGEEKRWGE